MRISDWSSDVCSSDFWQDNRKFPKKLERDRLRDLAERPDEYDHIWNGGYAVAIKGAYFAAGLAKAKEEHRIGHVAADPLLTLRIHCAIGGTGANSDPFVLWANQYIGKEVRDRKSTRLNSRH